MLQFGVTIGWVSWGRFKLKLDQLPRLWITVSLLWPGRTYHSPRRLKNDCLSEIDSISVSINWYAMCFWIRIVHNLISSLIIKLNSRWHMPGKHLRACNFVLLHGVLKNMSTQWLLLCSEEKRFSVVIKVQNTRMIFFQILFIMKLINSSSPLKRLPTQNMK